MLRRASVFAALVCMALTALPAVAKAPVVHPDPGQVLSMFPEVDRAALSDLSGRPKFVHGRLGTLPRGNLRTAATGYLARLAEPVFGLDTTDSLHVVSVVRDELGMAHVRVRQEHLGVPVDGSDLWVHADDIRRVRTLNGHLAGGIEQVPVPEIDPEDVASHLPSAMGAKAVHILEGPELVYYTNGRRPAVLAWKMVVAGSRGDGPYQDRVYLDADDGSLVARIGLLHTSLYRKIYTANGGTSIPGTLVFQEGGSSSDSVATAAYDNTGVVYGFYDSVFGRDSYDDNGSQIISTVHFQFCDGSYCTENNAAWSDYYGQFLFGDGDGSTFSPLAYSLDVTAHELTHAVTTSTANMEYSDEPGALNEAWSDIFGAACEAWDDGGVSADTWKIGEDTYTPGTPGDALRYMDDPTADGSSYDYYPERYTGTQDYGGVHLNSGIANLAFYLLSEGGTHPRNKTSVSVPAIGLTKARSIFYRALAQYMTTTTDFEGARNATAQAAEDLYGSTEADAVHAAWDAVGVPGSSSPGGNELANGVPVSNLSASTGGELRYFLVVPAGASNLSFAISGGSGDADLYVKYGSAPTTSSYDYRPYLNGNNETVSVPDPPAAGTWHVMVRAYSSFSGVSLVGSFDTTTANSPPSASFTYSTSDLTASFTDTSTDSDGSVASWSWSFGDGASSSSRNPIHTYASGGTYTATLTVTDDDGASDSHSASVTVSEPSTGPTELANGVAVGNLAAAKSEELHFFLDVPSGASNLVFRISGGSGDADLYVRHGAAPTTSTYDYRPYLNGNNETVNVGNPPASGTWYVMVRAYAAFSGVTLLGSYDDPVANQPPTASFTSSTSDLTASFTDTSSDPDGSVASWSWSFGDGAASTTRNPSHTYGSEGSYTVTLTVTDDDGASDSHSASVTVTAPASDPGELTNGVPVGNLSASTGQTLGYWIDVPAGASNLSFAISGGSGDADLYVKYGSAPTTSSYDYRPYLNGNNETVNVTDPPAAGRWYVMIRAYSSFSGVTLVASYGEGGSGTETASVDGSVKGRESKYYDLPVSGGVIDLSLTWDNSMDLDLYLYNPSGTQVASGTSTSKPETLSYDTNGAAGTYRIRVFNYTNQTTVTASYTLTVNYQP